MEGGWRFEGLHYKNTRKSLEKPFGHEREAQSWIGDIINPGKLERIKQMRAYEGHSNEWIIMEALLATLVENGPELPGDIRTRLHHLVGVLRGLFYPNMNPKEQDFMRRLLTETTTVDFSELQYDVNNDTITDIRWIWRNFDLAKPRTELASKFQLQALSE